MEKNKELAERLAMQAYPPYMVASNIYHNDVLDYDMNAEKRETFKAGIDLGLKAYDTNVPASIRIAYRDGYEAAEKDTIERAIAWLKENANKYIVDIGVGYGEYGRNVELVVGGMCWEHLKQELEESHD